MRRNALLWGIIGVAVAVGLVATVDRYPRVGRTFAGFWLRDILLVAVGGGERGDLRPFGASRCGGSH
jgi:hypothetical protein